PLKMFISLIPSNRSRSNSTALSTLSHFIGRDVFRKFQGPSQSHPVKGMIPDSVLTLNDCYLLVLSDTRLFNCVLYLFPRHCFSPLHRADRDNARRKRAEESSGKTAPWRNVAAAAHAKLRASANQ